MLQEALWWVSCSILSDTALEEDVRQRLILECELRDEYRQSRHDRLMQAAEQR
jgi:hypothetical protein